MDTGLQIDPAVWVVDSDALSITATPTDFVWVQTYNLFIRAMNGRGRSKDYTSVDSLPFELTVWYPCWDNTFIDTQTLTDMTTSVKLGSDEV